MASCKRKECLTIVDDHSQEAVDILVDRGSSGDYIERRLSEITRFRDPPLTIRTDQGLEIINDPRDQ
jgi:transposase InsO family protein